MQSDYISLNFVSLSVGSVGDEGLGLKYIIDAIRKTESFFLRSKLGGPELPPGGDGY